jgi:hypothetical protein
MFTDANARATYDMEQFPNMTVLTSGTYIRLPSPADTVHVLA